MRQPDVSIIIVNFNGARFIKPCLESIFNSATTYQYEIFLIDNASKDESKAAIQPYESHPLVNVIWNPKNEGFSRANNQGIRVAKGRYIFLLNNDTTIFPDTIQGLIQYYDENPDIGGLGPMLLNPDGSLQNQGGMLGHWAYKGSKPKAVSFICGAAFVITKEMMEQIGGLDENYFFYTDDIDYSKTILKFGKKLMYNPQFKVVHHVGQGMKTRKIPSIMEGYRGGLYLVKKHYPRPIYWAYKCVMILFFAILTLWHSRPGKENTHREYKEGYKKLIKMAVKNDIYRKD